MENAVFYCILNIPKYNKKFTEKKYTFLIFISIIHSKSFVFIVTQLADRILIIVKGFFSLPPEDLYGIISLAIGFLFTKKHPPWVFFSIKGKHYIFRCLIAGNTRYPKLVIGSRGSKRFKNTRTFHTTT